MNALIESLRRRLGAELWRTIVQFFIFGLIGGSGVFVDTAVVVFLRELWAIDERLGAIPAFIVAVTWNYELNRRFTFKKEIEEAELSRKASYSSFVFISLFGLLIRIALMHVLITYMGMTHTHIILGVVRLSYIASFIGIFVASLFNFLGSKFIAFRAR